MFDRFVLKLGEFLNRIRSSRLEGNMPHQRQLEQRVPIEAEYRVVPSELVVTRGGVCDCRLFSRVPAAGAKKVVFRTRAGRRQVAKVIGILPEGNYFLRRPGHWQAFERPANEVFAR